MERSINTFRPILLVEDSQNDAELAMIALARCRVINEVIHVRDGIQALEYLKSEGKSFGPHYVSPAVVLLDLKLPKMDGLEVLAEVRADSAISAVPIVMLTSSKEETDLIRSYELGVNAFVVKPMDFDDFMAAIQALGMFWGISNVPPPQSLS